MAQVDYNCIQQWFKSSLKTRKIQVISSHSFVPFINTDDYANQMHWIKMLHKAKYKNMILEITLFF